MISVLIVDKAKLIIILIQPNFFSPPSEFHLCIFSLNLFLSVVVFVLNALVEVGIDSLEVFFNEAFEDVEGHGKGFSVSKF